MQRHNPTSKTITEVIDAMDNPLSHRSTLRILIVGDHETMRGYTEADHPIHLPVERNRVNP